MKEKEKDGYTQSWELLETCVESLRTNDPTWRKGKEERKREREKQGRLQKAKNKSLESKRKAVQRKIDDMFVKLPVREREKIEREEMREKRRELEEKSYGSIEEEKRKELVRLIRKKKTRNYVRN